MAPRPPSRSLAALVLALFAASCAAVQRPGSLIGPGGTKYEVTFGPCLLHLNEPCANSRLKFYHIPSLDEQDHRLLNASDAESLNASQLDADLPTKIIIHGYNGSLYYEPTFKIAKAYLSEGGSNVVVLDWRAYSNMPCYPSAVLNTWQAGRCTAEVLQHLAKWSGAPRRFFFDLHIIGFSLGAHVAGFASAYLKPFRIGRITGLDPALPFFASLSRSWKLDANDARFVDVIHTNVGVLGKIDSTGHADFYVNGGTLQPACNNSHRPLCNHLLAPAYFAESISRKARGFYGFPCQSVLYFALGWCEEKRSVKNAVQMGEHCPKSTRGVYFVNTGWESPYGLGLDPLLADQPEAEETPTSTESIFTTKQDSQELPVTTLQTQGNTLHPTGFPIFLKKL